MFAKDDRTEQFLNHLGVKWKYTNDLEYAALRPTWDQANLGRSRARVEDAMLEYAERTKAGSSPPAPIVRVMGRQLDVLDGVQRLGAGQLCDETRFSAYIITTDSELMARTIRVMANHHLNGGYGEPAAWTRRQAVELLVIQGGMSPEEVSRLGGWKLADVVDDRAYAEWSLRIRQIGGPELPKGIVLNIASHAQPDDLSKAPKPIAAFCDSLKRGKFTNGDSERPVREFFDGVQRKKGRLHEEFSERLERFNSDPDVQAHFERRPNPRDPATKLLAALKTAKTVVESLAKQRCVITYPEECFLILHQIEAGVKELQTLAKTAR